MPLQRASIAGEQSSFYRNSFRQLILFAFVLVMIAFALVALIMYQHFNRPQSQFFVTTSDGRLIEIKPESP